MMMGSHSVYFPDEVLAEILQNLGPYDRKRCRLVCKQWLRVISHDVTLIENERVLVVDYNKIDHFISPNISYAYKVRIYVDNCEHEPIQQVPNFFKQFQRTVRYVHLIFHKYWRRALIDIIKYWPHIEHLVIAQQSICTAIRCCCSDDCDGLFQVGALNLKKLEMHHVHCHHIIAYLTNSAVNVNSLTFNKCTDGESFLHKFLQRQSQHLTEVTFDSEISPAELPDILEKLGTQLTSLSFTSLSVLESDYAQVTASNFNKFRALQAISLAPCYKSGLTPSSLLGNLHTLSHVSLSDIRVNDFVLLRSLPNLTCVDITVRYVKKNWPKRMVGLKPWPQLKCLRLIGYFSSSGIIEMAPFLPNLQILAVPDVYASNNTIAAFSKYNKNLRSLTMCTSFESIGNATCFRNGLSYFKSAMAYYGRNNLRLFQKLAIAINFVNSRELKILFVPLDYNLEQLTKDANQLKDLFSKHPSLEFIAYSMNEACYLGFGQSCSYVLAIGRDLKLGRFVCSMPWDGYPTILKG